MKESYQKILKEADEIGKQLAFTTAPEELKSLGKRQAALAVVVKKIKSLEALERENSENEKLLTDRDPEISRMAAAENLVLKSKISRLQSEIEEDTLPRDPLDDHDAIMEIRAAAGGDESSLFAAELFRMYNRYAERRGWKSHLISSSRNEVGGFKETIMKISGKSAYGQLKFESGVHRVQRVPETEKSGRIHTSTVTVAVLPRIEEDEFKIAPSDLKIETSTAGGHGGQSVNTTYSAIKITHVPTGITAQSQDERSQVQNRAKAMEVLTSRVFSHFQEKKQKELTAKRKAQIGTGDRSEKIRTYNFPQDRITDHRLGESFKQMQEILDGKIEPIVNALQEANKKLQAQNADNRG